MSIITERWYNSMVLEDDRLLEVCHVIKQQRGGYADRAEQDEETLFRLAGVEVLREQLPPEVTAEVIAKLVDDATRSPVDGA